MTHDECDAVNVNCLSYWFPRLRDVGVRVPDTQVVTTNVELWKLCDGIVPAGFDRFVDKIRGHCDDMGYPCFLRTGLLSAKHEYRETCRVGSPDALGEHIGALVQTSLLVDLMGLATDVWAVRKWLPLKSSFTAFEGLPINVERRYFVRDGLVQCCHPYWPSAAIRETHYGDPLPEDWEARLAALNEERAGERSHLIRESLKVAAAFDGYWSLDWAMTESGEWYAIDMAMGDRSWHWPGCRHGTESAKEAK